MSKTLPMAPAEAVEMVKEFQCPGCTTGGEIEDCGEIKPHSRAAVSWRCENHSAGTFMSGAGRICLGLPKGFNRVGLNTTTMNYHEQHKQFRLWPEPPDSLWNKLNVPVWAMEHEGDLFVRTYSPRINFTFIDVVKNGTMDLVPDAINVAEFLDEID